MYTDFSFQSITFQDICNNIQISEVNDSYYGNYTEYNNNEYEYISGEVSLWKAVLLQAIIDLKTRSRKKRVLSTKIDAIKWFKTEENKEDVKEVCYRANYGYNHVMSLVNKILNEEINYLRNERKININL